MLNEFPWDLIHNIICLNMWIFQYVFFSLFMENEMKLGVSEYREMYVTWDGRECLARECQFISAFHHAII